MWLRRTVDRQLDEIAQRELTGPRRDNDNEVDHPKRRRHDGLGRRPEQRLNRDDGIFVVDAGFLAMLNNERVQLGMAMCYDVMMPASIDAFMNVLRRREWHQPDCEHKSKRERPKAGQRRES